MTKPAKKLIEFWWPRGGIKRIRDFMEDPGFLKVSTCWGFIEEKEMAEEFWGKNNIVKMRIEEVEDERTP